MGGAGPLVEEYDRMCLLGDSLSLEDRSAALGGVPRLPEEDSLKSRRVGLGANPEKK